VAGLTRGSKIVITPPSAMTTPITKLAAVL
jgi:hypothetical protein